MEKRQLTGFGLGFRPPHYKWITENRPQVDWFEIISENFMDGAPRPIKFLEKLRSHYPVATHGVSLSIASLEPVDKDYLKTLKDFVSWLEPEIVSDHLCWTTHNGRNSHDLLPTPYTKLNLKNVVSKVIQVQDTLRRPLVLENPSAYVAFSNNEMTEAQFLVELVDQTECGILLDVNNAYVNWKNLGWNPDEYFLDLPRAAIKQLHIAGHSIQENILPNKTLSKILIDTHDQPVADEVWELYKKVLKLWPQVPTLLEWDEKIPEFEILMIELEKARALSSVIEKESPTKISVKSSKNKKEINLELMYQDFFSNLTSLSPKNPIYLDESLPVPAANGFQVYNQAYFMRLIGVLKDIFPTLAWVTEEEGFHQIATEYLESFPPHHYSINYVGQDFLKFFKSKDLKLNFGVPQEALRDIAALEKARLNIFETPKNPVPLLPQSLMSVSMEVWEDIGFTLIPALKIIDLEWDVGPAWLSVNRGEDPEKPLKENCSYLVWRKNENILNEKLTQEKKDFIKALVDGKTFKETYVISKTSPQKSAELLLECVSDGLILKIN